MGLTRAEQETVIRWDEAEPEVRIWSASPKTWRRMARLGVPPYRETTTWGAPSGRFYRVPVERFRWGTKRKAAAGAGAHLRLPGVRLAARLTSEAAQEPREEVTR